MVAPFPEAGPLLRQAYRELDIAVSGTDEQKRVLGDSRMLPRPWDPGSVTQPALRRELWAWLEDVVTWLNGEYVWDVAGNIPACWPSHPHIVHEVAVLADQRRGAGMRLTSDALEEWHRYALPAFVERMHTRVRSHCEEGHQAWPAMSRHVRHLGELECRGRQVLFDADVARVTSGQRDQRRFESKPRLIAIDGRTMEVDTGEEERKPVLDRPETGGGGSRTGGGWEPCQS